MDISLQVYIGVVYGFATYDDLNRAGLQAACQEYNIKLDIRMISDQEIEQEYRQELESIKSNLSLEADSKHSATIIAFSIAFLVDFGKETH